MKLIRAFLSRLVLPAPESCFSTNRVILKTEPASKVIIYFEGESRIGLHLEQYIPLKDVGAFLEAAHRLHFRPGINPHNRKVTARLKKIEVFPTTLTVADCNVQGPFWWTTPDLRRNYDPNGALILDVKTSLREQFEEDNSLP